MDKDSPKASEILLGIEKRLDSLITKVEEIKEQLATMDRQTADN